MDVANFPPPRLQRHTLSCTILADSEVNSYIELLSITLTLQGYSPKTMMYIVMFTIPTITIIATDIAIYFKVRLIKSFDRTEPLSR